MFDPHRLSDMSKLIALLPRLKGRMSKASIALLSGEISDLELQFGGVTDPSCFDELVVVVVVVVEVGAGSETADTGLDLAMVRKPVNKDTTQM